ncbi:MAG: MBOAT family protein [Flavobacteriales bacterium]|nr:MBOAT family protein [Flavobacteriales bacterium]
MLFNSLAFSLFLPVAFACYWWVFRSLRVQNLFVLLASWFFYGWWDWRFLGLLLISTFGDYAIGLALGRQQDPRSRRWLLGASLLLNLGLLGFFKYFDFFIAGMADLLIAIGFEPHLPTLRLILPVGISFYTFQTLSYTIDIHQRRIAPTRDPVAFAAFVAFFPQLVAGPIERARDLLPQFERPRVFDPSRAADGLRQMLWGFFKKLTVADPLGAIADTVFALDPSATSGVTLFFGAVCFAFQIYADFSGYSDIAIGCARLFGIHLNRNFAYPYFSRSIGEFWRRWHISLSSWLRDYVYLPLGGARDQVGRLRNILITFGVSGLWHGANWTYVSWGLLHGLYYVPEVLSERRPRFRERATWRDLPRMLLVFLLVLAAWVVFRAPSMHQAAAYLWHTGANIAFRRYELLEWLRWEIWWPCLLMLVAEWRARSDQHALARLSPWRAVRWLIYLVLIIFMVLRLQLFTEHAFIYFRF